ncbi:hypothetical protein H4R34_002118 [Dimargaris verticillata]|uniref:PH domain-containing protein n=1 Tax=Dimargaris verticillata TaxID=2761393 RepID=A0A9W8B356_9FUNG|nr:hypothetical protein H4R34_002118 [Dimargaris verticillata]
MAHESSPESEQQRLVYPKSQRLSHTHSPFKGPVTTELTPTLTTLGAMDSPPGPAARDSEEGYESDLAETLASQHIAAEGAIDSEVVLKRGYLNKRTGRLKVWKRKWFEYELSNIIKLSDIRAISDVPKKGRDNVIGIITTRKAYYLQADTPVEMADWIRDIRVAKEQLNKHLSHSTDLHTAQGRTVRRRPLVRSNTMAVPQTTPSPRGCSDDAIAAVVPSTSMGAAPLPIPVPSADVVLSSECVASHSGAEPLRPARLELSRASTFMSPPLSQRNIGPALTSPLSPSDGFMYPIQSPSNQDILPEGDDSSGDETMDHVDPAMQAEINSAEVIYRGHLYKKQRKYKHWSKRWFVLRPKSLSYYKSSKEHGIPRLILLDNITAVRMPPTDSQKSKRPCFCLVGQRRKYWLCAEAKNEAYEWINLLNKYIGSPAPA